MALVLIGPMGSGKSKLGKRVAATIGKPFVDTDRVVVAGNGSISQIFTEFGEAHFRALERVAVEDALAQDAVVALGGGAVLDENTRADLAGHRVALITVSAEAVLPRITGSRRPLLTGGIASWSAILEARRDIYESLADRTWDSSARPMGAIAAEIAAWATSGD